MGSDPVSDVAGDRAGSSRISAHLWALENAWEAAERGSPRPDPRAFLPPGADPDTRRLVALDLAVVDLEHRLKDGGSDRVEDHLELFPELRADREAIRVLIRVEYRFALFHPQDYAARFPDACDAAFLDELRALKRESAARKEPGGMRGPALSPGTLLEDGNLRIQSLIARHGMGEVYLAWHEIFKAEFAVKVSRQREMEVRFLHEIELHNHLGSHPHLIAAKNAGRFGDQYYLTMEYVRGVDLGGYLKDHGPLPCGEACNYIRQAALGLAHAHGRGIVHRDIKPSNLIRSNVDGSIKILDWGLARRIGQSPSGSSTSLTAAGTLLGTADYSSPEQISDPTTVGPEGDLYSLGCTLYHLLAGRPPFHFAKDRAAKLAAHTSQPAPPLPEELGVADAVAAIVQKLLEKSPERRYRRATDLVAALGSLDTRERLPVPPSEPRLAVTLDDLSDEDCLVLAQHLIEVAGAGPRPPAVIRLETRLGRIEARVNAAMLALSDIRMRLEGAMELIPIHRRRIAFLKRIQADERYFVFNQQPEIEERLVKIAEEMRTVREALAVMLAEVWRIQP